MITARKLSERLIAADSGDLDAENLGVLVQSLQTVWPHVFEDEARTRRRGHAPCGSSAPRPLLPSHLSAHRRGRPCRSTRRRASHTHRCALRPGWGCRGWPAPAPDPDRTGPPSSGRRTGRTPRRRCAWPACRRISQARCRPTGRGRRGVDASVRRPGAASSSVEPTISVNRHGAQTPARARRTHPLAGQRIPAPPPGAGRPGRSRSARPGGQLPQFGVRYSGGEHFGGFERSDAVPDHLRACRLSRSATPE